MTKPIHDLAAFVKAAPQVPKEEAHTTVVIGDETYYLGFADGVKVEIMRMLNNRVKTEGH